MESLNTLAELISTTAHTAYLAQLWHPRRVAQAKKRGFDANAFALKCDFDWKYSEHFNRLRYWGHCARQQFTQQELHDFLAKINKRLRWEKRYALAQKTKEVMVEYV